MEGQSGLSKLKLNAVLNVIKQCSTVLFPLITYPYISRVLGSGNFGRVSFANSVIEYGVVFAALGIPAYMVRGGAKVRKNRAEINKMATEVFTISIVTMLISLAGIGIFMLLFPRLRAESILIGILSLNILFSVLGRDWINTIYEDYFYITLRYIAFKVVSVLLIFLFVKKPEHYIRYAVIMLFAESGGYLSNLFYTRKYIPFAVTRRPDLKKHLKPLLLLFSSTLAVRIYIQSDIILLGFMKTDAEVGVYSLASRIYSVIKSVLNAIILVTIPRISYYVGNGKLDEYNELLGKLKTALSLLIFPCIIGALALDKNVMLIMGGESYLCGHRAFDILCIALLFAVLGCYYAQGVLIPNKKESKYFLCTSISAIINIILNLFLIHWIGIEGAALTTLIAEIIIMFSCRYYSRNLHNERSRNSLLPIATGCLAIFGMCRLIKYFSLNIILSTALSVVSSVILYFGILLIGKNTMVMEVVRAVLKRLRC